MSWQAYVDINLVGSGFVSQAAIADKNGGSIWARSSGFKWTADEVSTIAAFFADFTNGTVLIGGVNYAVTLADSEFLSARSGQVGFAVAPTTFSLVIATYEQGMNPVDCFRQVQELAGYLKNVGY